MEEQYDEYHVANNFLTNLSFKSFLDLKLSMNATQ